MSTPRIKHKSTRAPRPSGPRGFAMHDLPKVLERLRLSHPEVVQAIREAIPDKGSAFQHSLS